ncbi:hypothetical protein F4804DRAFT_335044 [Jackrogersella minutella]|nr:hypothetical protein F4804DRAFT_335044 [Jackrogersella minutella]
MVKVKSKKPGGNRKSEGRVTPATPCQENAISWTGGEITVQAGQENTDGPPSSWAEDKEQEEEERRLTKKKLPQKRNMVSAKAIMRGNNEPTEPPPKSSTEHSPTPTEADFVEERITSDEDEDSREGSLERGGSVQQQGVQSNSDVCLESDDRGGQPDGRNPTPRPTADPSNRGQRRRDKGLGGASDVYSGNPPSSQSSAEPLGEDGAHPRGGPPSEGGNTTDAEPDPPTPTFGKGGTIRPTTTTTTTIPTRPAVRRRAGEFSLQQIRNERQAGHTTTSFPPSVTPTPLISSSTPSTPSGFNASSPLASRGRTYGAPRGGNDPLNLGTLTQETPGNSSLNLGTLTQTTVGSDPPNLGTLTPAATQKSQSRKRANSGTNAGPTPKKSTGSLRSSNSSISLRKDAQINAAKEKANTKQKTEAAATAKRGRRLRSQKPQLTLQEARGIPEDNLLNGRFADQKTVYARLPVELRAEETQPDTQMVVEACSRIGVDSDSIWEACYHDAKGWRIRVNDPATAGFMNGKCIKLDHPNGNQYDVRLQLYRIGGPRVWIADRTLGATKLEIVEGLCKVDQLIKKDARFWLGTQEFGKTSGSKAIVVLDKNSGLTSFKITFPSNNFTAKFRPVNESPHICEVCGKRDPGHAWVGCPQLRMVAPQAFPPEYAKRMLEDMPNLQ